MGIRKNNHGFCTSREEIFWSLQCFRSLEGFIRENWPEMGSRSTENNDNTFLHQFQLITFL